MGFTVAIVGRPNVGKSTFFNRMLEERKAIVDDVSGVTRDRQYGVADWNGKSFNVIDTGGFVAESDDVFETEIRKQVKIAIEEADAIIFVTDVVTGITDLDSSVADLLRRAVKPVYLVVNKVDNHERLLEAAEFYSLGFDKIFFISSLSGSGTGDLLDAIVENIPKKDGDEEGLAQGQEGGDPDGGRCLPEDLGLEAPERLGELQCVTGSSSHWTRHRPPPAGSCSAWPVTSSTWRSSASSSRPPPGWP